MSFQISYVRERATLAVLAGASGGATLFASYIATCFTKNASDLLGFFGGMLGAAAAVLGSVWLERRKEKGQIRLRRRSIEHAIITASVSIASTANFKDGNIYASAVTTDKAIARLMSQIESAPIPDIIADTAFDMFKFTLTYFKKPLNAILAYGDTGGHPTPLETALLKNAAFVQHLALQNSVASSTYWSKDLHGIVSRNMPEQENQ